MMAPGPRDGARRRCPIANAPPRMVRMARLRPPVNGESNEAVPRRNGSTGCPSGAREGAMGAAKGRRPGATLNPGAVPRYKRGVSRRIHMPVQMPAQDNGVLTRSREIVRALRDIVPAEGVIDTEREMKPYQSDGLTAYRQLPMVVVLPHTTDQVARVLRYCHQNGIKVVPRGAGTSLSGGALPLGDGVLLGMAKFNRILEIDFANRVAVVEPGVTNLAITQAVEHEGFYYAPDPSSQIACTIGGNVAENSGGVHCLKYGLTANNLLGLEMVLITGEILRFGGKHLDPAGYDLMGILTGSEGLLGVVTEVTVRLLK